MKDLVSQLKKLKEVNGLVNPDRAWVLQNKEKLMAQVNNTIIKKEKSFSLVSAWDKAWQGAYIFSPSRMVYAVARPVLVVLLIIGTVSGGWVASVGATQNCLPGDMCYSVKLATEKTQEMVVSVTGSNTSKTQLQLEFASRRAKEIKKVVEVKGTDQSAKEAIQHLQDSIKSANEGVKDVAQTNPDKVVEMAKDVNTKTSEIVNTLKEVQQQTTNVISKDLAKDVVETKKLVNDAGIAAVEVAVQKQADGSSNVGKEEVKNLVEQKINSLITENENTKITATEVKTITDSQLNTSTPKTTDVTTSSLISTTTITPIVVNVSSTSKVVSTTAELKNLIDQAVQKVDQTTAAVKDNLDQAKTLMQNDQLMQAMQKVKESSEVTKDAQQTVVEVKTVVSQVVTDIKINTSTVSSTLKK